MRQLWTHLIKNKVPPTLYIDKFPKHHGIRQTDPWKAVITTSETGYLAKSKAFAATVNYLKYKIQKTDNNYFADLLPSLLPNLLPDQVNVSNTTDGVGELSGLHDLQRVTNSNGYEIHTTAADSLSSNGIVERLHPTLKERIRCMLYSA